MKIFLITYFSIAAWFYGLMCIYRWDGLKDSTWPERAKGFIFGFIFFPVGIWVIIED